MVNQGEELIWKYWWELILVKRCQGSQKDMFCSAVGSLKQEPDQSWEQ